LTNPSRRLFLGAAGLALTLFVVGLLAPGGLELQVVPVKGGLPLLVLPMKPGERFTLHYYHSVENAPIWEEHSLDEKGRIFIEEERYLKFGAGMGRMPGVGRMVRLGPYEVIEDMHMPTGNFILRIGSPGVDHTVIWRDHSVNLTGTGLRFSSLVVSLSQGIPLLALLLVALTSLLLGMGLPVTASYIVLIILAGPGLMDLGIPLLTAHMIVFWYR